MIYCLFIISVNSLINFVLPMFLREATFCLSSLMMGCFLEKHFFLLKALMPLINKGVRNEHCKVASPESVSILLNC